MKEKRILIQKYLVEKGLLDNERDAAAWLLSGKVFLGTRRLKAGDKVTLSDNIIVSGLHDRYISKGGLKLEKALEVFHLSPLGLVCLDAGASTGGFTDCLIKHGAQKVYAVDVGFGQLHGSLRQDERVVNLERTNLGDESLLTLSPVPTLCTCDLSYLSLINAVPYYRAIMQESGNLICLVKPLFEVDDTEARRTGVLPNDCFVPLLKRLKQALDSQPLTGVRAVTFSPVTGNQGTVEFFFHIRFGSFTPVDLNEQISYSVSEALRLMPYRKDHHV